MEKFSAAQPILTQKRIYPGSCAFIPLLAACFIVAQAQSIRGEVSGRVIDESANGIGGVLIVASGAGFNAWATTGDDGSFRLEAAGAFISARHARFKSQMIKVSDLAEPIRISLIHADETAWRLPRCSSLPNIGKAWIGGGMRVNPGRKGLKGPVYGEHDSHWHLKFGNDTLHIVDGYAWHSGLPLESTLTASQGINVRDWVFDDIVGLDLSGQTKEGTRWRWVGAPVADAIEYNNATQESADYFDRIIESICFPSIGAPKQ
jgi:hypothetical protein